MGSVYEPVAVEQLEDGVLQGYNAVLNLHLRWEEGQLTWHNPATGRRIATVESAREARLAAEARARELEERLAQQNT